MTLKETEIFEVAVLFEEREIADLFSTLVSTHGIKARAINPGEQFTANDRIITEPQFLSCIPEEKRQSSLLIGNKEALENAPGHKLARPLTEDKVLAAIEMFLS